MNTSHVATLNEQLLRKPELVRESLARYITEHLDQIENEMHWADDPTYLSAELKAELERRELAFETDPTTGISWEELEARLLNSR